MTHVRQEEPLVTARWKKDKEHLHHQGVIGKDTVQEETVCATEKNKFHKLGGNFPVRTLQHATCRGHNLLCLWCEPATQRSQLKLRSKEVSLTSKLLRSSVNATRRKIGRRGAVPHPPDTQAGHPSRMAVAAAGCRPTKLATEFAQVLVEVTVTSWSRQCFQSLRCAVVDVPDETVTVLAVPFHVVVESESTN